ncbi:MAG: hypothetical protein M1832_001197 [Thelocarpon impressellum]|nr:MAG: hypothetical protein M1832_001197 [Thelocarpon impressellum]
MATPADKLNRQLQDLKAYSACDISDALLKLKVPGAGFLPDVRKSTCRHWHERIVRRHAKEKVVGVVQPVLFTDKDHQAPHGQPQSNIPSDAHWVDMIYSGSVVVIDAPRKSNAVIGDIMASRMKQLGVRAAVVNGRVRDVQKLEDCLPVWALGTSTVGAGAEYKPFAVGRVSLHLENGVAISPMDIIFCDPVEGVVVIPLRKLYAVLEMLPGLVEADDRVKADVERGVSVKEAFETHRGGI